MNPEIPSAGNCKICDCHLANDEGLSSIDPAELLKKKREREPSLTGSPVKSNPFANWNPIFSEESDGEEEKPEEKPEGKPSESHKKYYQLIKEVENVEVLEKRIGVLNKMLLFKKQLINNKISKYEIEFKNGDYEEIKHKILTRQAEVIKLDNEIKEIFNEVDDDDVISIAVAEKKVEERTEKKKSLLLEIYELNKDATKLKNEMKNEKR